ncbi:DUF1614 domain-containing protein [Natranaerobius trueperi]|uniref:DUF1614 domain-containing protein n=1 Tax=Natranaerobius trueperi TaxID=759412 RepID=A0A226BVD8_9FIRM|nr:DUF1614 domain-containing protein [Natranaerobius trueperi]OWZ82945.1 hypothetical protein CDO51_11220 [Natranaerobius trueperi]
MTFGFVILLAVAALVYFGVLQRVLDRMGLTDHIALLFIGLMIVGGFLPDITLADNFAINIGGGLIPLVLVGYLFYKADNKERLRGALAAIITGIVVFGAMRILPLEPTYAGILDPTLTFGLIAGVIGYLAARSRRSAFIAGVLGLVLSDLFARLDLFLRGTSGTTVIGGAGVFDAIVLGGILAVGLAEIVGESYERIQSGHEEDEETMKELNIDPNVAHQEFSDELSEIESQVRESEVSSNEEDNEDDNQ